MISVCSHIFHCFDPNHGDMLSRCKHGLFHIPLSLVKTCTGFASLVPNFVGGSIGLSVAGIVNMVHMFCMFAGTSGY